MSKSLIQMLFQQTLSSEHWLFDVHSWMTQLFLMQRLLAQSSCLMHSGAPSADAEILGLLLLPPPPPPPPLLPPPGLPPPDACAPWRAEYDRFSTRIRVPVS